MVRDRNRRLLIELGRHSAGLLLVTVWLLALNFLLGMSSSDAPETHKLLRATLTLVGFGAVLAVATSARVLPNKWLIPGWSCGLIIPLASTALFLLQLLIAISELGYGLIHPLANDFASFRGQNYTVFFLICIAAVIPTLLRYTSLRAWLRIVIGAVFCLSPALVYCTFMLVRIYG